MAISSTTSSSSGNSTSSTNSTGSSKQSESKPESKPEVAAPAGDSVKLSEDASTPEEEPQFNSEHLSWLSGDSGNSLPGAFCAAPEGTQFSAQGEISTGLDTGPVAGQGVGTLDVTAGTNGALVTPGGNFVDTEVRSSVGVGTQAELDLNKASASETITTGVGLGTQATVPQDQLQDCPDPSNPESWKAGTDLSQTHDQFQMTTQEMGLGPVGLASTTEHRVGDIEGVTKDGQNVMAYSGQVETDLQSHQAGVEWAKSGSLDLAPGSQIEGGFGLNLSVGRSDSLEQVQGTFTEQAPDGTLQSGTLERTTVQNGVGVTASVNGDFQADINGFTFGGGGTLGGTLLGHSVYQRDIVKDYDNSSAQVETNIYAETMGQRQSEFVQTTSPQGEVTQTQTVTMATDPSYQDLWKDVFGPETRFDGNNVVLTLNDQMAQDIGELATRRQEVNQTAMTDVFSQVTNARELAEALTQGTNFSNERLLESLSTWRLLDAGS
jgi:hypothetical protein